MLTLGVLAGAFIAFGDMFYTLVMTGNPFGLGSARMLGGVAFSLGLILVVIGGAELFTGNNLIVMAWADKKVTTAELLGNWGIVYVGNFIGSVATAVIVDYAGTLEIGNGTVGQTAIKIAQGKVAIDPLQAFLRGILCNALVCLAVWLTFAAHHVIGKIAAIIFPIAAFVALGFEHCVANMYLIPVAMLIGAEGVTVSGFVGNLIPATLGNIVGGGVFVALVYWLIYLREGKP
ncbi:MAG: formate/nitrite transporter family protein [Rhodospirillaceae bacterium]